MAGRWYRRLRYWLRSGERARRLCEEMETHLELKTQEFMEDGMTEREARNAARRQFGNLTLHEEESRGTWIARWMSDLARDAVYAVRTLRRQPGFAAAAVFSAALGIGACSAIFAVANFALLRPLPVNEPSNLVSLTGKNMRRGKIGQSLSYLDVQDLRQAGSFEGIAAVCPFLPAAISGGGDPQRYWGSLVTANFFDVVRPSLALGRGFDATRDDRIGEPPAVVLSNRLWRSRFGADPALAGRTIRLNNRTVTVVGVTGPGFQGTEAMFSSDFWLPFSMLGNLPDAGLSPDRLHDRSGQWLMAVGRLRDGVNAKAAAAETEVIAQRLRMAYPATNQYRAFHVERAGQLNPGLRKMILLAFLLLIAVAVLVLLTACANIANLLLARSAARRKEISIRLAIGAGRGRLVRQLLAESVMLGLLGGVGGYAIAQLGLNGIARLRLPMTMPVDLSIQLDYRVTLFCIALSVLTGAVFGLVPALRATRPNLVGALKNEPAQFARSRRFGLRNVLVVAQVCISMVLLICSGLFLRSFYSAQKIDTGMAHRNLLLVGFDPSLNSYAPGDTRRILDAIVSRTGALPGVESAALTSHVPLSMEGTQNAITPEGEGAGAGGQRQNILASVASVGPGFFETFGIRMIQGEEYRPGVPAEDIVIVNQTLADKAFPRQNPVGRRILYQGRAVRIAGLVATVKSRSIGEEPFPALYFPAARDLRGNDSLTGIALAVRTHGNPAGYAARVRQAIREIDPALAVFDLRTMDTHLARALFLPRTAALLFSIAGLMGLIIATVGIYGVVSFAVARQTKEIGIRMALGARRWQVLGMVLRQGLASTAIGAAVGLALALALSRTAASLLYGVRPSDVPTFIAVPALLLFVAVVACLVPARRAASLDPVRTLRYE